MVKVETLLTHGSDIAWNICNNKVRNKLGNYLRQVSVLNSEIIDIVCKRLSYLSATNLMYKSFELRENIWDIAYNIIDLKVKLGTQNTIAKITRHDWDFILYNLKHEIWNQLNENETNIL